MSQDDSFEKSLDSIHRKLLSSKATLRKVFSAAILASFANEGS